jgi:nitroreductase
MDAQSAIEARRAVKHFDPHFTISQQEMDHLLNLTILAPTSFNIQHWRFVWVKDTTLRQKIRAVAWDQPQVTDASVLLVLTADVMAWNKHPERYWKMAPKPVQEFIVPAIGPFYAGKPELQRDEAMRSVGMAAQTLMLAAKTLGYDSCPMIGFDPQAVAKLIGLPADHAIGMLLAIGKATQPAWPKPGQLPLADLCFIDHF